MPDIRLTQEDKRILKYLQMHGRVSNVDLAKAVNMSTSPCWRRVKSLEESGVIKNYRTVLDRRKIGLGVMVYISIQIDNHSDADATRFEEGVRALPEVICCQSVSGNADFLLQVACKDLDAYAEFSQTVLRRLPGIKAMYSSFVLQEIKPFDGFPL